MPMATTSAPTVVAVAAAAMEPEPLGRQGGHGSNGKHGDNGAGNGRGQGESSFVPPGPVTTQSAQRAAESKAATTGPGDDLGGWVLSRVAEITGYRVEELDLDAHLEAELGIDSIRQIEIILGLRDELKLPADDGFKVSDYPNLRKLISYLEARSTGRTDF
jgi:acyl carrier protein